MKSGKEIELMQICKDISIIGTKCTGCAACVYVCAKNCISMKPDKEGFYYPEIDRSKCINCSMCLKNCPANKDYVVHTAIEAYAATSNDKKCDKSSSGGAFYHVARYVIQELNGYICGAILDENLSLRHVVDNSMESLQKMQGSKYIQSEVSEYCYKQIKSLLDQGKSVLFCGTPCQCAGMKSVMGEVENFYMMDLICHGTPSNLEFTKYIQKNYNNTKKSDFTFREKNKYEKSTFCFSFYDGKTKKVIPSYKDPFYEAFLNGYSYRESCYNCQYAREKRIGDISIGDCANWRAYAMPIDKVLSTVIVNSKKGEKLWNKISNEMECVRADYEKEQILNHQLREPVKRSEQRDRFYSDINLLSLSALRKKYCNSRNIKDKMGHFLLMHTTVKSRDKIKRIFKRGKF